MANEEPGVGYCKRTCAGTHLGTFAAAGGPTKKTFQVLFPPYLEAVTRYLAGCSWTVQKILVADPSLCLYHSWLISWLISTIEASLYQTSVFIWSKHECMFLMEIIPRQQTTYDWTSRKHLAHAFWRSKHCSLLKAFSSLPVCCLTRSCWGQVLELIWDGQRLQHIKTRRKTGSFLRNREIMFCKNGHKRDIKSSFADYIAYSMDTRDSHLDHLHSAQKITRRGNQSQNPEG